MIHLEDELPEPRPLPWGAVLGQAAMLGARLLGGVLVFVLAFHLFYRLDLGGFFRGLLAPAQGSAGGRLGLGLVVLGLALVPGLAYLGLVQGARVLFGRSSELALERWSFSHAFAGVAADLSRHLARDEDPRAVLEVDGPASERAPWGLALSEAGLLLLGMAVVYGGLAFAESEPLWSEVHVLLGAFAMPLLVWGVLLFGPPTLPALLATLGWAGLVPRLTARLVPGLGPWLQATPLLWVVLALSLGIGLFQLRRRERRFLLVTSRGLRVGSILPGGTLAGLGRPRVPTRLRFRVGAARSNWVIARGEREALEVRAGATSPRDFVASLLEAGFEIQVGGRGGIEGPLQEARRTGPAMLFPLALWLLFGWLATGFYHARGMVELGLGPLVVAGRSADAQDAARVVATCNRILDLYPSCLVAQEIRVAYALRLGRLAEARGWLAELRELLGRSGVPVLAEAGRHHEVPEHLAAALACYERLHGPPRRGWEPGGDALALTRAGAATLLGFPWSEQWNLPGAGVRDLAQAATLAPRSPAPATWLAWAFFPYEATRKAVYAQVFNEELRGDPARVPPASSPDEAARALATSAWLVDRLARAEDGGPLAEALRDALPANLLPELLAGVRDHALEVGDLEAFDLSRQRLVRARWVVPSPEAWEALSRACSPGAELPPLGRALLDPPEGPAGFLAAWPELSTAGARYAEAQLLRRLLASPAEELPGILRAHPWLFDGSASVPAPVKEARVRAYSLGYLAPPEH